MSTAAICLVLGALIGLLLKTRAVKASSALVCVAFGVALAGSPIGPAVGSAIDSVCTWAYVQLRSV